MEFITDNWGGARFEVPESPTVFQIVKFDSKQFDLRDLPSILLLWEMAKTLITEWESEALPEMDADLGEVTDPRAARVIEWASNLVANHRANLDLIPKN